MLGTYKQNVGHNLLTWDKYMSSLKISICKRNTTLTLNPACLVRMLIEGSQAGTS